MSLSNALFAGLSGLNANQQKLNVVGNNIANVNTVAFKSTRVLFKPQFYVTDSGGSQPEGDFGGTNPSQRGLGTVVAALDRNFNGGSLETTGRSADLAIEGEGFFIVEGNDTSYTRDGSFDLNSEQRLVTRSGERVQGYGVDEDFNIVTGELTDLTVPLNSLTTAEATTFTAFRGNLRANGPVASGASIFSTQLMTTTGGTAPDTGTLLVDLLNSSDFSPLFADGDVYQFEGRKGGARIGEATFSVNAGTTLGELATFFQDRLGINTTVPDDGDAATATPGVTIEQDASDPNSSRLFIAGNLGQAHLISLSQESFELEGSAGVTPFDFSQGTNAAGVTSDPLATGEADIVNFIAHDSLGSPVPVTVRVAFESVSTAGRVWRFYVESGGNMDGANNGLSVATGTLTFNSGGILQDSEGTRISISRTGTGAFTPLEFDLDFSRMTSLASEETDLSIAGQDGASTGTLASFGVGEDGKITGVFTNGLKRTLGQVAIATFTNPQGLIDRGGNLFGTGANSGEANVITPTSLGAGKIKGGSLELSNVDLSEEFINLIIASTGFTAASRVITTSDQLITELLNTSR